MVEVSPTQLISVLGASLASLIVWWGARLEKRTDANDERIQNGEVSQAKTEAILERLEKKVDQLLTKTK